MRCAKCKFSIYAGLEVFYQQEAYHPDCAVKVRKSTEKEVTKVTEEKQQPKLKLLMGGKK